MKINVVKKATNRKPSGFCIQYISEPALNKR